jgi:hypothetical protein
MLVKDNGKAFGNRPVLTGIADEDFSHVSSYEGIRANNAYLDHCCSSQAGFSNLTHTDYPAKFLFCGARTPVRRHRLRIACRRWPDTGACQDLPKGAIRHEDITVIPFRQPDANYGPLTELHPKAVVGGHHPLSIG